MSPEFQQPNSENTNAEITFVQQALAAADRSERLSRIIVVVRNSGWAIAFVASRRSLLPCRYFRPHYVSSACHQ